MTQASINKQFKEYKKKGGTMSFTDFVSNHNTKKNSSGIQKNIETVFTNAIGGEGIHAMFGKNPLSKNAGGDNTTSDVSDINGASYDTSSPDYNPNTPDSNSTNISIGRALQDPNLFRIVSTPTLKFYYIKPEGKILFSNGTIMSQFISKTGYNLGTNRITQDAANKYTTLFTLDSNSMKDALSGVVKGDSLFTNKYVGKVVQAPNLSIYFVELNGTKHKFKTGTDFILFKKSYGWNLAPIRITKQEADKMKDGGIIDYSNPSSIGGSLKKTGFVGAGGGSSTGSTTGDNMTFGINNYVLLGGGALIIGAIGWSVYKNFKK